MVNMFNYLNQLVGVLTEHLSVFLYFFLIAILGGFNQDQEGNVRFQERVRDVVHHGFTQLKQNSGINCMYSDHLVTQRTFLQTVVFKYFIRFHIPYWIMLKTASQILVSRLLLVILTVQRRQKQKVFTRPEKPPQKTCNNIPVGEDLWSSLSSCRWLCSEHRSCLSFLPET